MAPAQALVPGHRPRPAVRGALARVLARVVAGLVLLVPVLPGLEEPDLRGLPVSAAVETLVGLDSIWTLDVVNSVPEEVDDPLVVEQFPAVSGPDGGAFIPVTVGVVVPDVVGRSEQSALEALQGVGLREVVVSPPADGDDVAPPERIVLEQQPAAGALVAFGDAVALLVSTPVDVEPVDVPPVVGLDVDAARGTLEGLGLALRTPPESLSDSIVVTQQPEAGTPVEPGTVVVVTVTDGDTIVPDVVGEDVGRAREILDQARLLLDGPEAGRVSSQDPLPGTSVPPGSVIRVEVGVPADDVVVPNLLGLTPAEAREALGGTLVLGPVRSAEPVIAQTPGAGETVPRGSTVTVTQADPPDGDEVVVVPTVVGLQVEEARVALARSGLAADGGADEGTVLGQAPSAGSLVAVGSRVVLTVAVEDGEGDDALAVVLWVVGLTGTAALALAAAATRAARRGRSWAARSVTLRPVEWQPRVEPPRVAPRSVTIRVVPHAGRSRTWSGEAHP